jgi:hypothetical protein
MFQTPAWIYHFWGSFLFPPKKQQYGALEKQTIFGQPQRFGPEKLRVR